MVRPEGDGLQPEPRPVPLVLRRISLVGHLARHRIVEPVKILRQLLALVPHDAEGGEQHGVPAEFGEVLPFRQMAQQPLCYITKIKERNSDELMSPILGNL